MRRLLALAFIAANLGDLVTTHIALAHGAVEMNPLMAPLFANGVADLVKLAVTLGIAAVLLLWGRPAVGRLGWFLTGVLLSVVACNLMVVLSK